MARRSKHFADSRWFVPSLVGAVLACIGLCALFVFWLVPGDQATPVFMNSAEIIVSAFAFFGLLLTIQLQRDELTATREELAKQSEHLEQQSLATRNMGSMQL